MKLSEFKERLGAHPAAQVIFALPGGGSVPRHFHVTEVGHVAKNFVDCGGKFRASESCVLQTWTATDRDDGHRLTAGRLRHILGLADSILPSGDLPVEIEHEAGVVSQHPVEAINVEGAELTVHLGFKHTACLARERCGGKEDDAGAVGAGAESGCCGAASGVCC